MANPTAWMRTCLGAVLVMAHAAVASDCDCAPEATVTLSPGDSIQDAVDAASDGDVIMLAPGTYNQAGIDFGGKAITLTGSCPCDQAIVAATIIDGATTNDAILIMENGEWYDTVVQGITLRNGKGKPSGPSETTGGAVYMRLSGATFNDCVFDSNTSTNGGAIAASTGWVIANRCTFTNNTCDGLAWRAGGAIGVQTGGIEAVDCTFADNGCNGCDGGAVNILGSSPASFTRCTFTSNAARSGGAINAEQTALSVLDCSFAGNEASGRGGAVSLLFGTLDLAGSEFEANAGGFGGAVGADGTALTIVACTFNENVCSGHGWEGGGAIGTRGAEATVHNSRFTGNRVDIGFGGGISLFNTEAEVAGSVFYANHAKRAGAIRVEGTPLAITNCTIVRNTNVGAGAVRGMNGASLVVRNSIVWSNEVADFDLLGATLDIASSIVTEDGVDPLFVNLESGDLHLSPGSPAIDAGDNAAAALLQSDVDGNARISGTSVDIGAHEFTSQPPGPCIADINGDGVVDYADQLIMLTNWGPCP